MNFLLVLIPTVIVVIFCFLLVFRYIFTNKGWFHSPFGQIIIWMSALLGVFATYSLAIQLFPHMPILLRMILRSVLAWGMALVTVWRYIQFERIMRSVRLSKEVKPDA